MQTKHHLQDLLEPIIDELGYEAVRIITMGQAHPTLQIMIDRKDGSEINVEDCAKVSRAVSEVMDEKDPISDQYTLEVSSPGLDRPLTKLEHFKRFSGYEAKVETDVEVERRKRFKGKIVNVDDKNNINFDMEGTQYAIPFDAVSKARIIITDELLKEYEAAHQDDAAVEL